jgi:hypothetical protein
MLEELINLFEDANERMIIQDKYLFISKVSERTLCGALMLHLHELIKETKYKDYHVDVEYNRNKGSKLQTFKKTIRKLDNSIININCDLIVHSRGNDIRQDNLIAIEMKKSSRSKKEKDSDRERLIALTKDNYNDLRPFDRKTLPEDVCGYKLGVFYEINYRKQRIILQYYVRGNFYAQKEVKF